MNRILDHAMDRRGLLRTGLWVGAAGVMASCSAAVGSPGTSTTTTLPPGPANDPFVARWSQFKVPCVWNRSVSSLSPDLAATFRWRAAMGDAPVTAFFEPGVGQTEKGLPIERFGVGGRESRLFATETKMVDGTYSARMPEPRKWETTNPDRHWIGTDGQTLWETVSLYAPALGYNEGAAPEVSPYDPLFFLRKLYHYQAGRPVVWDLADPTRSPHAKAADFDAPPGPVQNKGSAMVSGLPIMPLLAHPDELDDPDVDPELGLGHAMLITIPRNRVAKSGPAWPATFTDGDSTTNDSALMGWRVRLLPSIDADAFPPQAAVIIRTLQRYGAYLCMSALPAEPPDQGFRAALVAAPSATSDSTSWDLTQLKTLSMLTCQQFEVMDEDAFQTDVASFAA